MARIWRFRREAKGETPEQQQERMQRERAELALAYRQTFSTEHGQRVLADILRRARVMDTTYDAHPSNAAYFEGGRRIGLEIIEMINADPADQDRLALTGQTEELF